jgi:hypothetical protein
LEEDYYSTLETREELKVLPCANVFNQFVFLSTTKSEKLDIILAYRPPSSGPTNTTELPGIVWREEQADAKGRELLETIIEEGLQQLVSFPTHIKGNMLDLVITNCADRVLEVCDIVT